MQPTGEIINHAPDDQDRLLMIVTLRISRLIVITRGLSEVKVGVRCDCVSLRVSEWRCPVSLHHYSGRLQSHIARLDALHAENALAEVIT